MIAYNLKKMILEAFSLEDNMIFIGDQVHSS